MTCLRWGPRRQLARLRGKDAGGEGGENGGEEGARREGGEVDCCQAPGRDGFVVGLPSIPEEPGHQPGAGMDLGPTGEDFLLEVSLWTKQSDAALVGKMMSSKLYTPQTSPAGGRKMLVLRGGKLCWEVAGQGELLGKRALNDGRPHEVAVSYCAKEDRFTLLVDKRAEGSGLKNLPDHPECKFAVGSTDSLPSWSSDPSNSRFDLALGAIKEVRWNGKKIFTGPARTSLALAYLEGQAVEYYSRSHKLWMKGHMHTKVSAPKGPGSELANYSVILESTCQTRSNVGLSALRTPLEPGEPCEYYHEAEDRWVSAHVQSVLHDKVETVYELYLTSGAMQPTVTASSILVRRRFPVGSHVLVYKGLDRGWVKAAVAEENAEEERPAEDDPLDEFELGAPVLGALTSDATVCSWGASAPTLPAAAETRKEGKWDYNWALVCLREEGSQGNSMVPAFLLRFHQDYISHLSEEQAEQERVALELECLDNFSLPSLDDDEAQSGDFARWEAHFIPFNGEEVPRPLKVGGVLDAERTFSPPAPCERGIPVKGPWRKWTAGHEVFAI